MGVFEPVPTSYDFPALEERVLRMWKERKIFEASLEMRRGGPTFVFYEGPPTANGTPHNGHVLTRAIKDLFPRYRTMKGDHVPRKAGWDTHGLPVEIEVEKELGIHGREAILEYGVEPFTRRCIENVFKYTSEWERMTERIAFWIDMDDAYVTYHTPYVESVWWALSELFRKGLLYRGHKVVWWWPQGGTALSAGEVGEGYRRVSDPSVTVRFAVAGEEDLHFLAWTTTPWTLPSNLGLAVSPELEYAVCRVRPADAPPWRAILASGLVDTVLAGMEHEVLEERSGKDLVGMRYEPLFAFARPDDGDPWRVVPGDFVTTAQGTGIVHIAPGFGEDDARTGREQGLGFVQLVTKDGCMAPETGAFAGLYIKDADSRIIADLAQRGLLVKREEYVHDYPFCPRAPEDALIQYARESWFIKTTELVDQFLANNDAIHWLPEHIRHGRFGDFLRNNVDWALSRERFWGTPLNVWINDATGAMDCPASVAEILERNPRAFEHFERARERDPGLAEHLMVHKPWIDEVTWTKPGEPGVYRRVPEVIDCWFDSGCVPFAQYGFPHRGVEAFREAFPADFISEAIDQTRGWFYSMLAVATLVFDEETRARHGLRVDGFPYPYKRCIVLGHVCDRDGTKESKSKKNYTPPWVILDRVAMPMVVAVAGEEAFARPLAKVAVPKGACGLAKEDWEGLDLARKDVALRLTHGERTLEKLGTYDAGRAETWVKAGGSVDWRHVVVLDADQAAHLGVRSGDVVTLEDPTPAPGGDAFRWFFYASNPPWVNTRHSLAGVRQAQKEFAITIYNVLSFFTIYANIDGFDPTSVPSLATRPPRAELDRWILSELHLTMRAVERAMEAYLVHEAARVLGRFVDSLSNWYVRRSRARFWAEEESLEKEDAFRTLHECLAQLAVLIAPFTPFFAEDLWQKLVRGPRKGQGTAESVHLLDYPVAEERWIDEALSRRMGACRELVSLGLNVRGSARLKVRQPLHLARIALKDPSLQRELEGLVPVIQSELNVREVEFLDDVTQVVTYKLTPNFKALGPRLGKRMQTFKQALGTVDAGALKADLDARGRAVVALSDGTEVEVDPSEVEVALEAKEGWAAASGSVGAIVLETELTEELVREMVAREIVNRVQNARKTQELDYADRIALHLTGSAALIAAAEMHDEMIRAETLAVEVERTVGAPPAEAPLVEGEPLGIALRVVARPR